MTQAAGIGTKAQQALKLQQEQGKQARLARTRQQREAEEARKFQLRQARRKEKHRGHLCAFFGNRFHTGVAKAANSVIIAVLKNRRSAGYRGELEGELRV